MNKKCRLQDLEYVLEEMEVSQVFGGNKIYARFVLEDSFVLFQFKSLNSNLKTQYEKNVEMKNFDILGKQHVLVNNRDQLSAIWVCERVECMVTTTEDEQMLYEIIESIYWRG